MTKDNPFEGFDFSQIDLAFDNPISQLLAKRLILQKHSENGWFLPIPFPTGIGKTHNMLTVIVAYLLTLIQKYPDVTAINPTLPTHKKDFNQRPQLIFITNSVDNVKEAYDKLLKMIDSDKRLNQAQKNALKNLIIYSPNTSQSVQQTILEQRIDEILAIFEINDKAIIKDLNALTHQIHTLENEKGNNNPFYYSTKAEIEETSKLLFQQLFNTIVTTQLKNAHKPLTLSQIDSVAKLLPAVKMAYNLSCVVFMTTKKFLYGVHQTHGKYHFTDNMTHHVLIIDEVDRQNNEILSHLVDSPNLDMLTTAKTIQAHLNFSDISHRPQYAGIAEKMADFHQVLSQFVMDYQLEKTFDMDKSLEQNQPHPLLFSDKLATNVTNINSALYFTYDDKLNQTMIFDKHSPYFNSKNTRFAPFVNRLNKLIANDFIYQVRNLVNLYQRNVLNLSLEQIANQSEDELIRALNSVLQQFNLRNLRPIILKQITSMAGKKHVYKKHDGTYHTRGISLTDIHRPNDTDHSVIFFHQGFGDSPTGLLADWIEQGCRIIGISATATNSSVVHNFDLGYLKYRLPNQILTLTQSEINQVKVYYYQQRNYINKDIQLNYSKLSHNFTDLLTIFCQIERPDTWQNIKLNQSDVRNGVTQEMIKKLNLTVTKEGDENDFTFTWLSKACQAIAQFYNTHQHSNRYMVLMLNRHLKDEIADFFEKYIKRLDGVHNVETNLVKKVDTNYLKSGKYGQEIKRTLSQTKNKVIVFTTYQTFSSGANPDYGFAEWELKHLKLVAEYSEQGNHTDIDCLYLEKPTNMISGDDNKPIPSRLTLLAQGMALQEANQLSNKQAVTWANDTIKYFPKKASEELRRKFYNKNHEDYISACCRDVEMSRCRASHRTNQPHRIQTTADIFLL